MANLIWDFNSRQLVDKNEYFTQRQIEDQEISKKQQELELASQYTPAEAARRRSAQQIVNAPDAPVFTGNTDVAPQDTAIQPSKMLKGITVKNITDMMAKPAGTDASGIRIGQPGYDPKTDPAYQKSMDYVTGLAGGAALKEPLRSSARLARRPTRL